MLMKFNNVIARNCLKEPINDQLRMDIYDAEARIAQVRKNRHKILEQRKVNSNKQCENIFVTDKLLLQNLQKREKEEKW